MSTATMTQEVTMPTITLDTQEQAIVGAVAKGATSNAKLGDALQMQQPAVYNTVRRLIRKGVLSKTAGGSLKVENVVAEAKPGHEPADTPDTPREVADPADVATADAADALDAADDPTVRRGTINFVTGEVKMEGEVIDPAKAAAASRATARASEDAAKAEADAADKARKDADRAKMNERDDEIVRLYTETTMTVDEIASTVATSTGTPQVSTARIRKVLAREGARREGQRGGSGSNADRDAGIIEKLGTGITVQALADEYGLSVARIRKIQYAAGVHTGRAKVTLSDEDTGDIAARVGAILTQYGIGMSRLAQVMRDAG